ncbi:nuclease-related domain-containing DEAD/DEAH box helicase [Streptomyces sp. NBC_00847]|uniref:nuclease-related domain-containing DEAD/DEAH box helicase n=1 Tax=Streptomyces sp. NBC_00847 TaxID=2975850 RepID=UPI00225AF117|nr:NERD domain-containing protein [Streptomyces sp. NBC_00847]MCX4882464.1 NERD domain-containing protein [Streptomyces sp. NBC_00847]
MILVPDLADVETTTTSNAERRVARLLRAIDGPHDAVAFHSVKLRSHAVKQQGEADFVVLWDGVVVIIEVKGGGVRKYDGVWYSIDRHGDWKKLRESPMDQAQSAMYALRDILQEEGVGWFATEAVALTPDIDAPPAAVEWKGSHWWAKDQMSIAAMTEAFEKVAGEARTAPFGVRIARPETLRARLFGEFTRMPVIDAQRGAVIEEQNRATEGQARVLAALSRNPRMLVFGGAGTGKSLVLAEGAKQEAGEGKSVLITFHSPALVDFFGPRIADRGIDLLPFAALSGDKQYDVVFVDEAQDLMNAEGMDALDSVIRGGRESGRWRMFLDPNNQARVDGEFDPDVCELVQQEALQYDLDRNVRNTRAIVHVVQEYLGADVGDPGIVHGDRVEWRWSDGTADVAAAEAVARDLVANGARRQDIWIINVSEDAEPRRSEAGFLVTNPRFAKGLEAEHVIVCGLPREYDDRGLAAFYVAVTRARVTLHVVASKQDKKRLQDLLRKQVGK